MKAFMEEEFLLSNETALKLYQDFAKEMPIFDFHNHLNAGEIYRDVKYKNITQAWLGGDHYKWRAMRTYGIEEELITGNADDYEKFQAWAKTVENAIGNPLYHWTHMELRRYFGIEETLGTDTCREIWDICNEKLKQDEYSVRSLLKRQKVTALCTTNDPIEDLADHKKLKADGFEVRVLPTFRPDKALLIGNPGYKSYIRELEQVSGVKIERLSDLMEALEVRLNYFAETGCLISDHSLENMVYAHSTEAESEVIFNKKLSGAALTELECCKFQSVMLVFLGRLYATKQIAMQLHIGALRNNAERILSMIGSDSGYDSLDDFTYAKQLSALLNEMDKKQELPKTILYCLNIRDYEMLAAMAGNFQSAPYKGKVQLGTAWWFCDNKKGMEEQLTAFGNLSLISVFIGMLTDSRSFLSFPRHEYFRRIFCNLLGSWVEDGEFPCKMVYLGELVRNVCYNNAVEYFGL